jgi:16S rRNA (cytosine967-C5)-methyltransferase
LRLNHPERKEEALVELNMLGMRVEDHGVALKVAGDKSIFELRAYREGIIEIQDWASQQIGAAVPVAPGELVWDACAGGGGKTLQIASRMRNRGALYASDIREHKLREVRRRATRARFDNIRTCTWQGEALPEFPREIARQGGFHWVLVDAPCTSTGTWRRNPDARFRVTAASLSEIASLQSRLLQNASAAVRPGGHLVYGTCSWIVNENEAVIERFLSGNPAFSLVEQGLLGSPHANADTMFRAVMRRVG